MQGTARFVQKRADVKCAAATTVNASIGKRRKKELRSARWWQLSPAEARRVPSNVPTVKNQAAAFTFTGVARMTKKETLVMSLAQHLANVSSTRSSKFCVWLMTIVTGIGDEFDLGQTL